MDTGKKYSYRTEEIWCDNNGKQIYGIAYIPNTEEEHKPLVVFLMNWVTAILQGFLMQKGWPRPDMLPTPLISVVVPLV